MKGFVLVVLATFVSGCGNPTYKGCMFGDKNGCMALDGDDVLFTIVTDGVISSGGVSNVILRGPRYEGKIISPGDADIVSFRSQGRSLRIGSKSYDRTKGNLFLVSVNGSSVRVVQFDISETEKIKSLLRSHDRVGSFF